MNSFFDVFKHVREQIAHNITDVSFNIWIKPIEPVKYENDTAYLFVKNEYHKGILTDKYLDIFKKAFEEILGFETNVVFLCEKDSDEYDESSANSYEDIDEGTLLEKNDKSSHLEKDYLNNPLNFDRTYEFTFDTFIVGNSNDFAYAACRAVAENQTSYTNNPLFIYGPSGLGKTHLLYAISNEVKKKFPEKNVLIVSAETFGNEFINTLSTKGNVHDFKNKYRNVDILLLDDIHFFAGKTRIQEEFFHTFNELYQLGKQIVLTSDRPPKDIQTLEERMRNRFEWGLITDIQMPELEMRIAIIKRKAEILDIKIPNDVAEFIASKLKRNIRQLEGAVKKIKANKLYLGTSPSIASAQIIIKDILNDNQPTSVAVDRIINEVAKTYNISADDIRSKKREASISLPRQTAVYVVREISQLSLEEIGKEFGDRDHATISYTLKKMEELMSKNTRQKEIINDLIKNIRDK